MNSALRILTFCFLGLLFVCGYLEHKVESLESYSKYAYKDGFEAGSKTFSCDVANEHAFQDGQMNGLKRAEKICNVKIIRYNGK